MQPMEPARRNRSLRKTYALLGICILLLAAGIVTAFILISGNYKKTLSSIAGIRGEISQLNKISGNYEKTLSAIAKLKDEIPRLNKTNSEMTNGSLAELQSEVSRLRESVRLVQLLNSWRFFKQKEYYFSSTRYRWEEGQQFCVSINSNLVVINSQEEQDYVRLRRDSNCWIGLHDSTEEGVWRWVDGTDYASNVKFWAIDQPNVNSDIDEDCVVASENGFWHDWPCDSMHFVICEKPAD
ncbi:C-type lectin domain family 4 member F-like [Hypanus sabinus]|uniref:C-type lectin domain family 4 member F-like n=1 Tax=Hypanus sabinus TaxID=79690 RepID=UPI0028C4CB57|nr:C-type lectin domain family 4 member F-like [Hypanus sabinus]